MPYINLPPNLQSIFAALEARVLKLETAQRFTAPNVDFTTNTPTNPRSGDIFYDTDVPGLRYWDTTQWVEIADDYNFPSINALPTTMQSVNNNMVYTGNPVTIDIQRVGKMITANAEISFTNVTNFGTGQYYFDMPAGIPPRAHDLAASGFAVIGGTYYTCFATLGATADKMYLWVPTSNGGSSDLDYNSPAVFTTSSTINITGIALLA